MKIFQTGLLMLLLFSCALSQEDNLTDSTIPDTTVTDTTVPTTVTDTTVPTTETTTVVTTPTPDTTTTPKTTTSTTPKTTTTSTTPKTTTSTTTVLPTTSKPPEPPVVEEGSWNITDGNTTCIRADLKVLFTIYVGKDKEWIALSPNATSTGSTCSGPNSTQELKLNDQEYDLSFIFVKDDKEAYIQNITLAYTLPSGQALVSNDTKLFNVQVGNSYRCLSTETVQLGPNVTMEIFSIHIQAFGAEDNKDFGSVQECEVDNKVDDFVPIAVGCALLALVVVVLIAYFVGRRRSRQKGYQSV